jgi:hypothetical protein
MTHFRLPIADCRLVVLGIMLFSRLSLGIDTAPSPDIAISNGLSFLAKQQNPDGWFDGQTLKVSTTSRALLGFLSAGSAPDVGKYGLVMRNASDWLLSQQGPDGYFGGFQRGMRAHALATLALAELYGVDFNSDRRMRIRAALAKAASVIFAAQSAPKSNPDFAGGWNVERNSSDSTVAVTASQSLALEACRQIGIEIPPQSLQHAVEFVLRCRDARTGGCGPAPARPADPPATAAAIITLSLLDRTGQHAPQVEAASRYLAKVSLDAAAGLGYASTRIVTLWAYQGGDETWSQVGQPLLARLTKMQEKDGGWPVPTPVPAGRASDRTTATALAVQTLTIPYRLLPIDQR